jgi:undecaprenyl diphosphate synthase
MGKQIAQKPVHVCIIPDGNRRWAKAQKLRPWQGHKVAASSEHILALLDECIAQGVSYVTLWAFSTENWKRDKPEVDALFSLLRESFRDFKSEFIKRKIRFRHIGRKDRLPKEIVSDLESLEKETKSFSRYYVQICLDYGGRDELVRAFNVLLKEGKKDINEDDIESVLDTHGIPDPDLIIRTSGEQRLSGFMPFQSAYAEFYFAPMHFPDFGPAELRAAFEEFGRRKRNFGK